MALEWKDEFGCGVEEVDEQHRKLVGLLNTLEQMIADGIESGPDVDALLGELASDTVAHFSFEEDCMMRYRCPAARENREAHALFLDIFAGFQSEIGEQGTSAELLARLHETAATWVVDHILNVDVQLKPCVH